MYEIITSLTCLFKPPNKKKNTVLHCDINHKASNEGTAIKSKSHLLCCLQERLEALMKRSLERSLQLEQRNKRWSRGCPAGAGKS